MRPYSKVRHPERDPHLDTTGDQIDGLSRHERRAGRHVPRQLASKFRPLLRVAEAFLPFLLDVAVLSVALQLGELRARGAQLGMVRVLFERRDELGEDADAGVLGRHARVTARSRDVELEVDSTLLSSREQGERLAVDRRDTAKALVENECNAVPAVAMFDGLGEVFRRARAADLFVKARRKDNIAVES